MPKAGKGPEASGGLAAGLWEQLVTGELSPQLDGTELIPEIADLADGEAADRLSRHLAAVVARVILDLPEGQQSVAGSRLVAELIRRLGRERDEPDGRVLHALWERLPTGEPQRLRRPLTPVLDTTLLTNATGEPSLAHELRAEIASANAIDMVVAFIRRSGIRPLTAELRHHTGAGRRLRVLTTTYTRSTEARALDDLAELGAEVRVSYETGATRLHAKSWIFHRAPSTTTAYIGSSNLTHTAQQTGLEWNVRVSAARNPDVIDKMRLVVDSYWENGDFVPYDPAEFLRRTSVGPGEPFSLLLSPAGIELRAYQDTLLERIELAREQGHHRNLLVAATGTGKTVMAAVDYRRLRRRLPRARLLFVAHREELLTQSRATFAHAVGEGGFGELWVGGRRPVHFEHVFASIQSLSTAELTDFPTDQFDVVIVDEFHHAHAPTYRRLLDHLRPAELLGLTATPDRADGADIVADFFGGRIAAELRLWDAVDGGYLVPFAYYGLHDGSDLSGVPWRRGRGYEPAALTNLYTADHAWVRLVIAEVVRTVSDVHRMRALGFCVSVAHARWMADRFNDAGIRAVAISGETAAEVRRTALLDLASGEVSVVFAVDLFNEGIDVPEVDTLLMLRPTESGTLFLQQLGRGLRRADGKAVCTVLDFVGNQRREFRYDRKYRAMLGGVSRTGAQRAIEGGFPFLPAGCSADLDPIAQQVVLRSIRESLPSTWPARVAELRSLGDVDLATFLAESGLDLEDIYAGGRSWMALRTAAGLPVPDPGEEDAALLRAVGRLSHVDDTVRIAVYRSLLAGVEPPDLESLDVRDRRLARMLLGSLSTLPAASPLAAGLAQVWAHPQVRAEALELLGLLSERMSHVGADLGPALGGVPLRVHARYTRIEVLAALGAGAGGLAPPAWQSGVWREASVPADVFAFTLDKSRGGFSPTTRYRDAALSPELIHWESQTATSVASETGQRYLHHAEIGSHILLPRRRQRPGVLVPGPRHLRPPRGRSADRHHLAAAPPAPRRPIHRLRRRRGLIPLSPSCGRRTRTDVLDAGTFLMLVTPSLVPIFTNGAQAAVGPASRALIRPRRRKRDGHIVYDVRLRDPSGRTYSRTFETKKAAQGYEASERADRARGSWIDPSLSREPFAKAAGRWMEAGIHKRPSSLDRDRSILHRYLLPILGNRALESITPWEPQKLVNTWAATGSPASVSRQYATLRAIFNYAVTTGMLRRSPCRGVNLPPVEPRESPLVTAQDLEYLALHLPGYEPFPYLGGVLGLRWAEAAGLRVRSVDFTKNTVAVEQQWTRGAGGVMISQRPKTRAGRRTIASPDWLMEMLANHLAERGISQDDRESDVFLGSGSQKLDYSNWRSRVWIPATEAAGLGGLRFHDLRHTAGTAMVAAGVDVKTVQIRLGHASPITTLRIYAQGSSPADRAAADVLGKIFKPTSDLRARRRTATGVNDAWPEHSDPQEQAGSA